MKQRQKKVSFTNLVPTKELQRELDDAYRRVMDSGRYILSEEVSKLEEEFALYQGDYRQGLFYATAVNSGFDALKIAIMSIYGHNEPLSPQYTVGVPINAPLPVWMAVMDCNARPVPIYVDHFTYNITTQTVMDAIGSGYNLYAIIAVHLYGRPIDDIVDIARQTKAAGIGLIEDCSQAHGAMVFSNDGKITSAQNVGSFADVAVYSFYPTKNLGGYGDGGMVVTRDPKADEIFKRIRFYGMGVNYGINSRMDELQAAFLRVKLNYLESYNSRRARNALRYFENLTFTEGLFLPRNCPGHVWHQFVIRHERRDELKAHLAENGIETLIHYPVIPPCMPYFAKRIGGDYSDENHVLGEQVLSLPMGNDLMRDDIEYVSEAIRNFK